MRDPKISYLADWPPPPPRNLPSTPPLPSLSAVDAPSLPIERYKIAYAEYRAEVQLGLERQKIFLTLNPAIAALAAGRSGWAVLALLLAAAASLAGVVLVRQSHERYRHTRDVLLKQARELGIEDDWQTTGGMREARGAMRLEGPRVVTTVKVVLVLYAVFDVGALVLHFLG